ncbi:MAG: hypothetical protein H0V07_03670 [Propionibacteriales bacterium]|nr:hypothetical protein [Propionibacteriales bacterium]
MQPRPAGRRSAAPDFTSPPPTPAPGLYSLVIEDSPRRGRSRRPPAADRTS